MDEWHNNGPQGLVTVYLCIQNAINCQFVQKFFGSAKRLLQQLSGWLVSVDAGGEDAGCGGPGLVW